VGIKMSSRSDELRFYEAEKRILRQFEDDKDVQDYLEYLENQDEELFIRVSDLKIEKQELEEELGQATEDYIEVLEDYIKVYSEARELKLEISELKFINDQLEQELKVWTEQED
jgi:aspartyl-tRNA synthetase